MTIIKLKEYGSVLTGREFGKTTLKALLEKYKQPFVFDFEGVFSMGSSFGDEVLLPVAKLQDNEVTVLNVSKTVKVCLGAISEENNIKFTFD